MILRNSTGQFIKGNKPKKEWLDINREKHLGVKHTKEQNKMISEKFTGEGNPFYNKKHSNKTKENLSKIHLRNHREKKMKYGFKGGEDNRRINTMFKKGHEVPKEWRDITSKINSNKKLTEEHKTKLKEFWNSERGRIISKENRAKIILPKKDTSIEVKIQNFLKQLNIDFLTHQYIKDIEHGYQCDILIPSINLVIECDGNYWHKYPIGRDIDHIRTSELLEKGFKVLRLWEFEIKAMSISDFQNTIGELNKK